MFKKSLLLSTGLLKEEITFADKQAFVDLINVIYPPFEGHKYMELGIMTGLLKGAAHLFQSFHWQTGAKQFYGDHLLYERMYEELGELVDRMAEKAVAFSSGPVVSPSATVKVVAALVDTVESKVFENKDVNAKKAHYTVKAVMHCMEILFENLKQTNKVSLGIETVVADSVDKLEEFCYLISRRNIGNTDVL